VIKLGQRVHLKFSPEAKGTVSRIDAGKFRVTWDSADRRPGQRRVRHWYTADAFDHGMEAGNP
jgi:hypothetical protein